MTRSCGECANFDNEPVMLEHAIPGLNILSSAFGSVLDETGLCHRRDAFVTPVYCCREFQRRSSTES